MKRKLVYIDETYQGPYACESCHKVLVNKTKLKKNEINTLYELNNKFLCDKCSQEDTPLQTRMKLVDQIYELSTRINLETDLKSHFDYSGSLVGIDVCKWNGKDFDYKFKKNLVWINVGFETHTDMKEQLANVIVKLESFL